MLPVLGREAELALIESFVREGQPRSALLIEGAAGIGKTTLLRHGVAVAASEGRRVLSCRPLEAETDMAFAGLDTLLAEVIDEVRDELSQPQRVALEIALLRAPAGPRPLEARAVGSATLASLQALAARQPLVVAIDDLQWLDSPSARALQFALHRLADDVPVSLLFALRRDHDPPDLGLERDLVNRLTVGPLDVEALRALVKARLGEQLSAPAAQRLAELSAGSPFYALELARLAGGDGLRRERPLSAADLRELVGHRIAALPQPTVEALGLVAALPRPRTELIVEVLEDETVLDPAFTAEVLEESGGELRFTHPLLAETAYAALPPAGKRAMHRRLADAAAEVEERARHLAASAVGPDSEVAASLDAGATAAASRGAPGAAAELLDAAARLTPSSDSDAAARRRLEAAINYTAAGDGLAGTAICRTLIAELPPGEVRADALATLGFSGLLSHEDGMAFCEQAVAEAVTDEQRARCLLILANNHQPHDLAVALETAEQALAFLDEASDPSLTAWALATVGNCQLYARPAAEPPAVLYEALALERSHGAVGPDLYVGAAAALGFAHLMQDRLDEARELLTGQRELALSAGDLSSLTGMTLHLTELECRAGDLPRARAYADEGLAVADEGVPTQTLAALRYARALVAAHEGDVELTRSLAQDGMAIGAEVGDDIFPAMNKWVLGFLELSLGNPTESLPLLDGLPELWQRLGYLEPGCAPFVQDRIDGLVAAGQIEAAEEALDAQDKLGKALGRPRLLATGARARGLIAASRGELDSALASLDQALVHHRDLPDPHQRARTLLALGATLRRAGRRRDAREALDEALGTFEAIGEPLWAERAREAAARLGGRAPAGDELTPAERRVAELVAEGHSNREVADALYVTVRTVEANLTRIYSKLGLRSRAELAARWHEGPTSES